MVNEDSKFKSIRDVVEAARAQPGRINFGSGGVGSMSHLGLEALAAKGDVKMLHVPYKGVTLALADVIGGSLQMALTTVATATPLMKAGRLRALAVTSPERTPFLDKVPTVSESGLPGFQVDFWWGLMGPAGMPPAVVKRLNEELNWALQQPDMREMLAREAAIPKPGTPEDFSRLVSFEIGRWTKLIKDADIKAQ